MKLAWLGVENWKEFAFFFLLTPLVLIFFFFYPNNTSLELNFSLPTLATIFFSNYVHLAASHLISNLAGYLIITFLILKLEMNSKIKFGLYSFGLIVLPFLIFIIEKFLMVIGKISAFPHSIGFSGIVAFFMGSFLVIVYRFLKKKYSPDMTWTFLAGMFIANVFIWALFQWVKVLIAGCFLILLLIICLENKHICKIYSGLMTDFLKDTKKNRLMPTFILISLLFCFGSLFALLPVQILTNIGLTNIIAHYVGYILGIFVAFIVSLK